MLTGFTRKTGESIKSIKSRTDNTSMSANHASRFPGLPFRADSKSNETASIPGYEISFPALDSVAPGFSLGEFREARFEENGFDV